jgi:hypothetical protein
MKTRQQIEAHLDRSLERQIVVPRLDARFNASVWERIAADEARATNPVAEVRAPRASRWLLVSNVVGALVALALIANFGLRLIGAPVAESGMSVNMPLPEISAVTANQLMQAGGYFIAAMALAFGLSLTSFGRRLRATFF